MTKTFLVLGAHGTATSTMVGLANTAQSTLCLYEVDPGREDQSKYIERYAIEVPTIWGLFDPRCSVTEFLVKLAQRTTEFSAVGTKIPGLRFDLLSEPSEKIVCVRSLISWVSQPKVRTIYNLTNHLVRGAVDYLLFQSEAIASGSQLAYLEDLYEDQGDSWRKLLNNATGQSYPVTGTWKVEGTSTALKESAGWLVSHPSSEKAPAKFRKDLRIRHDSPIIELSALSEKLKIEGRPLNSREEATALRLREDYYHSGDEHFLRDSTLIGLQKEEAKISALQKTANVLRSAASGTRRGIVFMRRFVSS